LHNYQQQLAELSIVKLSSVAKTSDFQSYIKKIIRKRETEIIEQHKFCNIFDKTISVPLIELNSYINQKILDNNFESETIN